MSARVTGRAAATPRGRAQAAGSERPAPFAPVSFAKRADADAVDTVVLFEIDGVDYTVPAVVRTGDAIKLLVNSSGLSEAKRGAYLIESLAGNAALNALLSQAEMTDGEWHTLIKNLSEHAFGRLEEPGN